MTYVGKGASERYLACSNARRQRGCSCRLLYNYDKVEQNFLAAALSFDPTKVVDTARSSTREELERVAEEVTELSVRLAKLLDTFGSDSTDEIVEATAFARDRLQLARLEQSRLRDMLIVEENGAGLAELSAAIDDLCSVEGESTSSSLFVVRARISHAAKAAGITAMFHEENRRVEVRCIGHAGVVWFSCMTSRPCPARDWSGRFISRE